MLNDWLYVKVIQLVVNILSDRLSKCYQRISLHVMPNPRGRRIFPKYSLIPGTFPRGTFLAAHNLLGYR